MLTSATIGEWADHEQADGWLSDPVLGPVASSYGVGMVAQRMIQLGASNGSSTLVEDGLRTETAEAEHPNGGSFELLSLAEAYAWEERNLAGNPAWQAARPILAAFLSDHLSPVSDTGACQTRSNCYDNLKLVDAVAYLALLRTDLNGTSSEALLDHRAALRAQALTWLAQAAAHTGDDARLQDGSTDLGYGGILSDPTSNPLAYHALSTLMLGRAIELLGRQAPRVAVVAFSRAAHALICFMAPDGDVSYIGRGQGQVWTVGASIDSLAIAARLTPDARWRGRYLAGIALALERLQTLYPGDGWGFPLVPRLTGTQGGESYLGVDPYADAVEYNGLTLWALDDAAAMLARTPPAPLQPVPSHTQSVFVDPSHTRFATVVHGDLWFAVHATDAKLTDARYGFGLIAAELHTARAGWQPALPARPLTQTAQVGGLAMRVGSRRLYPVGTRISAAADGTVTIHGRWDGMAPKSKRQMIWTYRPTRAGDGVTLSFRARPRCTYQLQVWYTAGSILLRRHNGLSVAEPDGSVQRYSLNIPVVLGTANAFHSAYAENLGSSIITIAPTPHSHIVTYTTTMDA